MKRLLSATLPIYYALLALPTLASFQETEQKVQLGYLQNEATVVFETGGERVTKVKPLCDCMTISLDGSRIVAKVDTSKFDRDVEKQLYATTADGKKTLLTVAFAVPQPFEVSSRMMVWKRGSKPQAQVLRITIPEGSPVRDLSAAQLVGEGFDYVPRVVVRGREYTVTLIPKSTEKPILNRLQLVTDVKDYRARRTIFLQVK